MVIRSSSRRGANKRGRQTAGGSSESGKRATNKGAYTIDELARIAGSTVRNVRAYQDRGLLSPPQRRGRVGIYDDVHLGRLRMINQLLARGYTLANIREMFEALESGLELRQLMGVEKAIAFPWTRETPRHYTMPELLKMYGISFDPRVLSRIIKLGILEPDGMGYRAPRPKILLAGAELAKLGMKVDDLITVIENLRDNVERVADEMIGMLADSLDQGAEAHDPTRDDVPRAARLIGRLRPIADMAIESEVSRALESSVQRLLGDRLAEVINQQINLKADNPE